MVRKIVSGGQSGVDRAALDVAMGLGLAVGGWCPRGRRAEDGPIDGRYLLTETPSAGYAQRTRRNVRDSDFTLILSWGEPTGGTALTLRMARRLGRPHAVIDLADEGGWDAEVRRVAARLAGAAVLNVAGPRESERPGAYARAGALLRRLLATP
jgi:hypothetical protein